MDYYTNNSGFYFTENKINEKRLRNLFDNLSVGIILIDRNYQILYHNYKLHEYIKMISGQIVVQGDSILNYIKSGERKELFTEYLQMVFNGENVCNIWEVNNRDNVNWIEFFMHPLKSDSDQVNEIIIQVTDVTGIKVAENKMFEHEVRYKAIVDSQTEMICRYKTDGTILFVNKAYCEFFEHDRNELTGMNFYDLLPPDIRQKAKKDLQSLSVKSKRNQYIQQVINKNGNVKWISGTDTAIFNSKNEIIEIQSVGTDITQLKNIEEKLRKKNNQLNAILKVSPDIIFIFNKEGKVLDYFTSDSGQLIAPREVIINRNYRDFIPDELIPLFTEKLKQCFLVNEVIVFDYWININEQKKFYESKLIKYTDNEAISFSRDITKRKESENEIVQTGELYRKLVNSTPYAIVIVDHKGNIIFCTKQYYHIFECKAAEKVLGKNIRSWIIPKDKSRFNNFLNSIPDKEKVNSEQFTIQTGNNECLQIEVTLTQITSKVNGAWGLILIIKDITDEVITENKLKLLHSAVEQSPVSVLITDFNGKIEYINNAFAEFSGYSADEAIGKNPNIIKSGLNSKKVYKNMWDTIKKGNEWKGELINKNKDGVLYTEFVTISPVKSEEGEIKHFLGIKENITEFKKVLEKLEHAKEKAEESNRLKTTFLSNISHEIRTPLNGILGFSSLLQSSRNENYTSRLYAEMIEKCGNQLLTIMNDILEISMIESKNIELKPTVILLSELIDSLTEYLENTLYEHNKKSIKVIRHIPKSRLKAIYVDDSRLKQLLMNILNNAIKFTNKGQIELGYKIPNSDTVQFFVKDTGTGIKKENMSVIFEPFRQGTESLTREYGGNGLGLAISKVLAEKMGGKIFVRSTLRKGSTFYVELPVARKTKSIKPATARSSEEIVNYNWKGKKILIVEDNYSNYVLLKMVLQKTGASILIAQTGEEGLKYMYEHPDIDIILLDIMLPDINGNEVARRIKKDFPELPIIALTAYTNRLSKRKAMEDGIDEYLSKPFNKKELLKIINILIHIKK